MVEKRMKKLEGIQKDGIPPAYEGEKGPDLLLVSWGSTKGAVLEAVSELNDQGTRTAALHFPQVWPLDTDRLMGYLESASQVACVEGNATAQFARLIRRETGFVIEKRVLRYDGLPITPEFIIRELNL